MQRYAVDVLNGGNKVRVVVHIDKTIINEKKKKNHFYHL